MLSFLILLILIVGFGIFDGDTCNDGDLAVDRIPRWKAAIAHSIHNRLDLVQRERLLMVSPMLPQHEEVMSDDSDEGGPCSLTVTVLNKTPFMLEPVHSP